MSETFIGMPGVVSDDANAQAHTGGWRTTVSIPEDTLRWGPTFPQGARKTLANTQMRRNLGHATRTIRTKRGQRVAEMPDWEDLRSAAEAVKFEVESRMPELLEEFERNVTARGGIVHWARDKHEANRIIADIIKSKGVDEIVKVKSMATQETNLNEYLKEQGIHARETDLAEMIVQLADDMPSHIVVPAIHRNRSEVRGIFLDRMEDAPRDLSDDPTELTAAARSHLRKKFLHAKVAVSGTNMGVAETGTVSIFESEGNGRMCLTLPDTLITLMGIEKLVPRFQDIEIFSQLLPRSATGERMNPYTSMWTGVTPGDGPQEFHLILMDNGRTKVLADPIGRQALACIRCGSCMNICPVYQHTSGHAYGSVYPGPIGAILTPQLTQGLDEHDPVHTLRVLTVWRVWRGLPRQDRYPDDPHSHACTHGRRQAQPCARRVGPRDGRDHPGHVERKAVEGREHADQGDAPLREEGCDWRTALPGLAVDPRARPAGRSQGDLPSVVEAHSQGFRRQRASHGRPRDRYPARVRARHDHQHDPEGGVT